MLTRQDYMSATGDKWAAHRAYFGEICRENGLGARWVPRAFPKDMVDQAREAFRTDVHMNQVSLTRWDSVSIRLRLSPWLMTDLKARGESWSPNVGTCIVKEAMRQFLESE